MMNTEVTKRAFDGKYVLWGYTVDPGYDPKEFNESNIPYIPQRWVVMGVFDNEGEANARQRSITQKKTNHKQKKGVNQ